MGTDARLSSGKKILRELYSKNLDLYRERIKTSRNFNTSG
jgi:hypothetical protein